MASMHIYTDGSYQAQQGAGFAVAIAAKHTNGSYSFQGAFAGNLDADAELCVANGPVSNNVAEVFAVTWVLIAAAIRPGTYDIVIHPDSTTAMGAALAGPASTLNALVAAIANGLHHFVGEGRRVLYEHIHGHIGHPWNELADCLADAAALKAIPDFNCSLAQLLCLRAQDGSISAGPSPLDVPASYGSPQGQLVPRTAA